MGRIGEAVTGGIQSLGLLVLRIGAGGLMAYAHGWDKLTHFSERAANFYDPFGTGGTASLALVVTAEFFCSLLVVLGLATRIAAVPLIATMGVAAFLFHASDPLKSKELALLHLAAFTTLFCTGPGRFSLDALWSRRRRKQAQ